MTTTTTIPSPTTITSSESVSTDGDHDRFAHYVRKRDQMRAYVDGRPVVALCGKVWVPHRDPDRYPVCPACAKLREMLLRGL